MSTPRPIQSVTTLDLYERWAEVYDTDGNILQAIDDLLLPDLLSQALPLLPSDGSITITELGCGTGRNTVKLLLLPGPKISTINALDLSPQMLDIARGRCEAILSKATEGVGVRFHVFNALNTTIPTEVSQLKAQADLVLSTLVLEHLPVATFFKACASFLQPGGILIVTNMHAEMGRRSQAGFMDTDGVTKVQGESFNYETEEVFEVGRRFGFVVVGEGGMWERGIGEEDIASEVVGGRGAKWVGCKVWFGGVFRFSGIGDVE
ncbi:S-adenosyl-L-methionine-dependent methyltransferase [Amylocarpus encephaloides]|uniref:S-adenosyl-L-methionine-dependent methyltransferase n=1 Tax=Amylocarpus encephaloides TaxID=45428 RepID=A0A9P7YE56_9HELO|nr:S-adenosyl-L-methionine-dependent methyltransferase [Amylocarpus encephaloides]